MHFLTGDKAAIDAVCKAAGFRYAYDERSKQYAHASAMMVATPGGKLSRYFYGLEYSARDLRLGIIEASEEGIGTVSDTVTLLCFQYDPHTGKYTWTVLNVIRIGGVLTILALGSFVFLTVRRERRAGAALATTADGTTAAVPAADGPDTGAAPRRRDDGGNL